MTPAERSTKRRQSQAGEIRLLRRALLDAITVFDIGGESETAFHKAYADVIARAYNGAAKEC